MTTQHTLGQRLAQARREKAVRDRRDITQADVADATGYSRTAVSEWEADLKSPREDAVKKLADYLGVTAAYLRYGISPTITVGGAPIRHDRTFTEAELAEARRIVAEREAAAQKPAPKPRKRGNEH
jgi:transcriptional regulator with XRE-family HTH domain